MTFHYSDGTNVLALTEPDGRLRLLYSKDWQPIVEDMDQARVHVRRNTGGAVCWIDPVRREAGGYVLDGTQVAV